MFTPEGDASRRSQSGHSCRGGTGTTAVAGAVTVGLSNQQSREGVNDLLLDSERI